MHAPTAKATPHGDPPATHEERPHPRPRKEEQEKSGRAIHLANGELFVCIVPSVRTAKSLIRDRPDLFFFSSSVPEEYANHVVKKAPHPSLVKEFCEDVKSLRDDPMHRVAPRPLVFYQSERHTTDVAACAVLLGAYLIVEEGLLPEVAAARLARTEIMAHIPFEVLLSRLEDVGKREVRGLFTIAEDA